MLSDLIRKSRSIRRFKQSKAVSRQTLESLVDVARLSSSAGNLQPLKYRLIHDPEGCAALYPHLRWAGYIKDWDGPEEGERPAAYIVVLRDNNICTNFIIDHGIALQSMKLAAVAAGLGSCIVGTADRVALREAMELPSSMEILVLLALGKPAESSVIEDVEGDDIRYWRDDAGVIHVPKRPLKDVIV